MYSIKGLLEKKSCSILWAESKTTIRCFLRGIGRNELPLQILANFLPDLVGFDQVGSGLQQLEVRQEFVVAQEFAELVHGVCVGQEVLALALMSHERLLDLLEPPLEFGPLLRLERHGVPLRHDRHDLYDVLETVAVARIGEELAHPRIRQLFGFLDGVDPAFLALDQDAVDDLLGDLGPLHSLEPRHVLLELRKCHSQNYLRLTGNSKQPTDQQTKTKTEEKEEPCKINNNKRNTKKSRRLKTRRRRNNHK